MRQVFIATGYKLPQTWKHVRPIRASESVPNGQSAIVLIFFKTNMQFCVAWLVLLTCQHSRPSGVKITWKEYFKRDFWVCIVDQKLHIGENHKRNTKQRVENYTDGPGYRGRATEYTTAL